MKMKDPEKYMIFENRQGFNENKIKYWAKQHFNS